jgi:hypothetical protein
LHLSRTNRAAVAGYVQHAAVSVELSRKDKSDVCLDTLAATLLEKQVGQVLE